MKIDKIFCTSAAICILSAACFASVETFTLGAKDAGRVIDGGGREISGGVAVDEWVKGDDGIWSAPLPAGAMPSVLLINGEVRPIAQYPKDGKRLKDLNRSHVFWLSSQQGGMNRPPRPWELTHLQVDPKDIPANLDVASAFVNCYHMWDESTVKVSDWNPMTGIFTFASKTEHPAGSAFPHDYVLRNIKEGMTPGRWMHDRRANRILYWPHPGEESGFKAEIPLADSIFKLGEGADGITIRNFKFRLCNRPDGTPGLRGINPPGIIDAKGAKGLVVENCEFRDSAGQGIRLFRSPGYKVKNCKFENLGAGGVVAIESYEGAIEKCVFRKIGTSCASSCAILAGGDTKLVHVQKGNPVEKGSTRVVGNIIEDVPYCGIVMGGNFHYVGSNTVKRAMRVLRDGSAIYLSRAKECIVERNFVMDDRPEGGTRHGLYFDEFSWNSIMRFNRTVGFVSPVHGHRVFGGGAFSNVFENAEGSLRFAFVYCKDFLLNDNEIISGKGVKIHGTTKDGVRGNVFKGDSTIEWEPCRTTSGGFVVDGENLSFRKSDTLTSASGNWKKILVSVDRPETGKMLAKEIESLLPASAKHIKVVAGDITDDSDADCVVFGFVPKKEWVGKSPSFVYTREAARTRAVHNDEFSARLKKLMDAAKKQGMKCVFVSPFPIDEYTPNADGSPFGDYSNSLVAGLVRQTVGHHANKSGSPLSDAYMILSRRLDAGEKGLVESDRITPTRKAVHLAARETVGIMFRDADALRSYR